MRNNKTEKEEEEKARRRRKKGMEKIMKGEREHNMLFLYYFLVERERGRRGQVFEFIFDKQTKEVMWSKRLRSFIQGGT